MKTKLFSFIFLAVLVIAAVFVVPAFAQGEVPPAESAPVFDMGAIAQALQTLVTAILVPCAVWLARFMSAKYSTEVANLSEQQKGAFYIVLRTLVFAAEQMSLTVYIDNKLDWVTAQAEAWLEERNLPIDLDEIRIEIEAIIAEDLNFGKLTAKG